MLTNWQTDNQAMSKVIPKVDKLTDWEADNAQADP